MKNNTSRSMNVLFLAILVCIFGISTVSAQPRMQATVDVGKVTSKRLTRQVNNNSISVNVANSGVANAWFDSNNNRLKIEGVGEGRTRVVFAGTYRQILVGRRLEENAIPFRHVIDVTVLRGSIADDRRTIRIDVSRNYKRTYRIEYLLGSQFARQNEENIRWRNVDLVGGDGTIAATSYDGSKLKFSVSGVARGRTTVVLRGERYVNHMWQKVIRQIEVTVG